MLGITDISKTPAGLKAIVSGRVQGVYYRVFVERLAKNLQLCGYVQNRRDLTVEVYAEGTKKHLEELLGYLKVGPPGARVDNIVTFWIENSDKYVAFSIVP